ncbi:MAG: glycosyltransferase family 39 protein [Elusimicrobia bacterium]|nr:glycosyltransferase family 39 protein [Elusimicrobiota bacterium]
MTFWTPGIGSNRALRGMRRILMLAGPGVALLGIWAVAVFLRLLIPLFLIASQTPDAIHEGFQTACYTETAFLTNLSLVWLGKHIDALAYPSQWTSSVKMIIQGVIDSSGCFLVFGMLRIRFPAGTALRGAALYAIWLPSLFYSSQILGEAYTPILMLAFGYAIMRSVAEKQGYAWYGIAGLVCAVVAYTRFDNILILPAFALFILVMHWRQKRQAAFRVGILLAGFALSCLLVHKTIASVIGPAGFTHSMNMTSPSDRKPSIGVALYNALGEYPSTYAGLRLFSDCVVYDYAKARSALYESNGDKTYKVLKKMLGNNALLAAYVREVIVAKPILYADWIITRTFCYLPANPFFACIIKFVTGPHRGEFMGVWYNQFNHKFSQRYQGLKYLDYTIFAVFVIGVWTCRRDAAMLSLMTIYFGVLVGHVFTQCGEAFHSLEQERVFMDPRYLLGMVSIWPVFLPLGFTQLKDFVHRISLSRT